MPIYHTQPAHLAALATLHGIGSADVERARVLELGCASGGNLLPMALRFPSASFVGIDLSARHIDDGRLKVDAFGLENIKLLQGDLTELDLSGQQFDYIICHGVFSWVPKPAREAIFRICQQTLSSNGIAYVSYNVLPGWHLRGVIRDLCLHYAGADGTPRQRVDRARAALGSIAAASMESGPYGQLLRTEARRLRSMPAAYILGEFLSPDNAPMHVGNFVEQAGHHGLDYLCEADLLAAVPPTLGADLRNLLRAPRGAGALAAEQHLDYLTGRPFRRSVLVRHNLSAFPPAAPGPAALRGLHLASPLRAEATAARDAAAVFTDGRGPAVRTEDVVVRQALTRLASAYPATLTFDDLAEATDLPDARSDGGHSVGAALLDLVLSGRVDISAMPLCFGPAKQEHPRAWSLARHEATLVQPWITTQRHDAVPAKPLLKALLPHMDGTLDCAGLRRHLVALLRSGAVSAPGLATGQPLPSFDRLEQIATHQLEQTLAQLARDALLEPNRVAP